MDTRGFAPAEREEDASGIDRARPWRQRGGGQGLALSVDPQPALGAEWARPIGAACHDVAAARFWPTAGLAALMGLDELNLLLNVFESSSHTHW